MEAKVATLRIVVPEPVAALSGLKVTRDGEVLRPEALNKYMPVDKGTYVLKATANGKHPWTRQAHIHADGFEASFTVVMRDL
ncbi:hypothetical protein [Sorangium sp. So ce887]|uniref:hypothetical protein n=1 Tax=Sorangium sp. So ce887 TaxID=3133324 RepID=UPI003F6016E3